MPFVFTLDPSGLGVLLQAPLADVLRTSLTAGAGVAALAMACGGWFLRRATFMERTLAGAGGLLLCYPSGTTDLLGLACAGMAVALHAARGVRP